MNRLMKAILALVGLLIVAAVAGGVLLLVVSGGSPGRFLQTAYLRFTLDQRQEELNRPLSADSTPRRFEVELGDNPALIAQRLAAQNLIADPELFLQYVRLEGIDTRIQAETYFLSPAQSIVGIAQSLTDPRSTQFPFRILEGQRIEEIAATIDGTRYFLFSGADFMRAVGPGATVPAAFSAAMGLPAGASLEGFLFPGLYTLPAAVTPELLRDTLIAEFERQVTPALRTAAQVQGLTIYQAVTLGSIIQREAVHADEHPMIASVYRNRLTIGMKLDADPTVQYGLGYRGGSWWPQITIADYTQTLSPYNTYLIDGFPPGPIASPGLSAIQAAITPASSDFFYFRADCSGNGYHRFARTFDEHLANACPS